MALILVEDHGKLTKKKIPITRRLTTCKIGLSPPAAQDRPSFFSGSFENTQQGQMLSDALRVILALVSRST